MTQEILTREPTEVNAGDTIKFYATISTSDFPTSTWTATARMTGAVDGSGEVTATVSGGKYLVTFPKATTAKMVGGHYTLVIQVTDGTERFTTYSAGVRVNADITAKGVSTDNRTHARKTLEAIEAVIEGRATKDQENYAINGRSLTRTPLAELVEFREKYKAEVTREERADRIASGLGHKGNIYVRFV